MNRVVNSSFIAILSALVLAGCSPESQPSAFGLRIVNLNVGGAALKAEVADSPQSLQNGLMFRNSLPENQGMLFVLGPAEQASFWMKNTKIPLSIAFIDGSAVVREVHDMQPFEERTTRSATDTICYALEVNQGWFQKHHVDPGAKVNGIPH